MCAMTDVEFTAREQRMMALAWRCFDGEPKVDFNKLARLNGMSHPGSAQNAWYKIRKKLAGQTPPVCPVKKHPVKKRARKEFDSDDSFDDTPSKKNKAPRGSLSNESVESEDEVKVGKVESPESPEDE